MAGDSKFSADVRESAIGACPVGNIGLLDHWCRHCERIAEEIRDTIIREREGCARTAEKLYRTDESLAEWPAREVVRKVATAIRSRS